MDTSEAPKLPMQLSPRRKRSNLASPDRQKRLRTIANSRAVRKPTGKVRRKWVKSGYKVHLSVARRHRNCSKHDPSFWTELDAACAESKFSVARRRYASAERRSR